MKRGLALCTVLLLLAATWLPLALGQDEPEYEFDPELGDLLSTYGRGYVENLVLWSGAGVGLVWGPSYDGDQSALDDRLLDLEGTAGGTMPPNATPIVVPFAIVNPSYVGDAPIDHSEEWMWNGTDTPAKVSLGSVGHTIMAETDLAMVLMEGGSLDAEGLLLLDAAVEAVRFTNIRMGYNGTDLGPINMSDANMTDDDDANGWWLPVTMAEGSINASTGEWEGVTMVDGPSLKASLEFLRGLVTLYDHLMTNTDLVGAGKPFPAGTDTEIAQLAGAVLNNIKALYYDTGRDLFYEDGVLTTENLAILYMTLMDISVAPGMEFAYDSGWARWNAERYATLLVQLQREDGTLSGGYDTALGGFPGAFIPPYAQMGDEASNLEYAMAIDVLYDASESFGGITYDRAGQVCLAALEDTYWNDAFGLFVDDPLAETPSVTTSLQVAGIAAYAGAAGSGVDLAKHRIPELWGGMVGAGLPLSETDATGENYSILDEPDTNNNTIWKHNWSRGTGFMHGMGPVLGTGATHDMVTHNWTVYRVVDTRVLMEAAVVMMGMDSDWFTGMGAPMYSMETAYNLVHWTPEEWNAWGEEWQAIAGNLSRELDDLKNETENCTKVIEVLRQEIANLTENVTRLEAELNESQENETLLRAQVDWLRELLEETNETVDELEEDIVILEETVERLTGDIEDRNENITKLLDQLRASENNVTELQWELDNASAALAQAEQDLAACDRKLADTEDELKELQGRMMLTAIIALIAGMIIVVVILKVQGKL